MELMFSFIQFSVVFLLPLVCGHGRLMDPPSRSSMWRVGFATPKNYNDEELNCGGFSNEWYVLRGKCGICGDPWQDPTPRNNEAGGLYGKGIITKTYSTGQDIQISVHIKHNNGGWFEFRLCANNDPKKVINQSCLDQHLLKLDGGDTRHYVTGYGDNAVVVVNARLPTGLKCTQCVLQWKWNGGDQLGMDPNGTACFGCGHQEEHYGCSDIAIGMTSSPQPLTTTTTRQTQTPRPVNTTKRYPTTTLTRTPRPVTTTKRYPATTPTQTPLSPILAIVQKNNVSCYGINNWAGVPMLDKWCAQNCARGMCPPRNCGCSVSGATKTNPPVTNKPVTVSPTKTNKPMTVSPTKANQPLTVSPTKINQPMTVSPTKANQPSTVSPTKANQPLTVSQAKASNCHGAHLWAGIASLDNWCSINCATGLCPPVYCQCPASASIQSRPPLNPSTIKYPQPVFKTTKMLYPPTHATNSPLVPISLPTRRPQMQARHSPLVPIPLPTSRLYQRRSSSFINAVKSTTSPHTISSSTHAQAVSRSTHAQIFSSTHAQTTVSSSAGPTSTFSQTTTSSTIQSGPCHAINTWKGIPLLDKYCNNVCVSNSSSKNSYNNVCSPLYCECNFT